MLYMALLKMFSSVHQAILILCGVHYFLQALINIIFIENNIILFQTSCIFGFNEQHLGEEVR